MGRRTTISLASSTSREYRPRHVESPRSRSRWTSMSTASSTYPPLTSRRTRGTWARSPTTRAGCPRRTLRGWSTTRRSSRLRTRSRKKELLPNGLESYCFNMKSTMEDESLKAMISEEEKKTINNKCDEALKWLGSNQLGEVDEFQDKQKELEVVCNPIISKFYQQGGAPGGTMPNGMPSGMPKGSASAGSNSSPTIEEVD